MSWVEHEDLVEFYANHRNRPEDLYPSEERFLPGLARDARTVLDVGCGAGGFMGIWQHYNPALRYTGVDASARLIDVAGRLHPEGTFLQADGAARLPFDDASFDVVAALGWLHLEPNWRTALPELWRVAGRRLFFDLRLHDTSETELVGRQQLALSGPWDGETTLPYIVAPWPEVAGLLIGLDPGRIRLHGYMGSPADTVMEMDEQVCFATVVVERGQGPATIEGDLPFAWPTEARA